MKVHYRMARFLIAVIGAVSLSRLRSTRLSQAGQKDCKYKLFIPYHLGYGEHGAGASIPPYSALVFTVELLGINE